MICAIKLCEVIRAESIHNSNMLTDGNLALVIHVNSTLPSFSPSLPLHTLYSDQGRVDIPCNHADGLTLVIHLYMSTPPHPLTHFHNFKWSPSECCQKSMSKMNQAPCPVHGNDMWSHFFNAVEPKVKLHSLYARVLSTYMIRCC